MNYLAVVHQDPGSNFGVSFPDFPGCVTAGRTLAEAKAMAETALDLCLDEMCRAGEPIPPPSTLAAVLADPDFADFAAFLVVPARDVAVHHGGSNEHLPRTNAPAEN